jgi:hypothetical protein
VAHSARNILVAFIASPGDVAEERRAARDIVEELNKVLRNLNWQIDLLGWEDTMPGVARPQELINKDVDACGLFIGLLWKRWGQPTGEYSSGFEEEFERVLKRREGTGSPEIWLSFKRVDPELLKDPGEQLGQVLAFRQRQIQQRQVLFKEFADVEEWRSLLRTWLLQHVIALQPSGGKVDSGMNGPGSELVRTWVTAVITPIIRMMEREQQLLDGQQLRWDDQWDRVEGIEAIRRSYDPSWRDRLEQFERFYPDIRKAIDEHDRAAAALQERYQHLFQSIQDSPELRALYEKAVSPESLAEMGVEMRDVFNFPENVAGHLKALAEHTVNGDRQLTSIYTTRKLWERYGSEFRDLLSHPPLKGLVEEADAVARRLLQVVEQLFNRLKEVREDLSLRHNVSY